LRPFSLSDVVCFACLGFDCRLWEGAATAFERLPRGLAVIADDIQGLRIMSLTGAVRHSHFLE
jgi:hypothetical protein